MDNGDVMDHVGEAGSVTTDSWRAASEKYLQWWRPYDLLTWNCHIFAFVFLTAVTQGSNGPEGTKKLPESAESQDNISPVALSGGWRLIQRHRDVVLRDVAETEALHVALVAEEQALGTWQQVEPDLEEQLAKAYLKAKTVQDSKPKSFLERKVATNVAKTMLILEVFQNVLTDLAYYKGAAEGTADGPKIRPYFKRPYTEAPPNREYEEAYVLLRLLQRIKRAFPSDGDATPISRAVLQLLPRGRLDVQMFKLQ